ncbi:MAG: hypothetical protein FWH33_07605 [Oscillospiraceae bacterium]|nr:hypothetical protein [Oscillospiraceae bacterium]
MTIGFAFCQKLHFVAASLLFNANPASLGLRVDCEGLVLLLSKIDPQAGLDFGNALGLRVDCEGLRCDWWEQQDLNL